MSLHKTRSLTTNASSHAKVVRESPEQYEISCLQVHNKYRKIHGCPPLTLNKNLTKLANNWAQSLARNNKMEHNPTCDYGENIYFSSGQEVNAEMPVRMWYHEIQLYDFEKNEFSHEAGHFTQLIWRDTKEVGIGLAIREERVWVVANYNPPGNVIGQFEENVPRPKH